MKRLEFGRKIHNDNTKLKKGLKHHWSWGMDGNHMGEHGRWADGAET
jgi:hypothetical protein